MDLTRMINTQFIGTAFRAVPTDTTDRMRDEIQNEIINLKSSKDVIANDFSYKTNSNDNLVAFNDPLTDKLVLVSLDRVTLKKLESHFGEDDFYKRKDEITRLNNKAESFISGWFADIAYKREFLSADKNQDGDLDSDEYLKTKNEFNGSGEVLSNGKVREKIEKVYMKVSENQSNIVRYNQDEYIRPTSIDEELNTTLKIDKNFDSKITLRESFNKNSKFSSLSDAQLGKEHIKEAIDKGMLGVDVLDLLDIFSSKEDKEKERKYLNISLVNILDEKILNEVDIIVTIVDENKKRIESLEKLKQNNGDMSALSSSEKEAISIEIYKSKNEDGQIDTDKLEEIINYTKTAQIYKQEEPEQMGKYYEEKG